MSVDMLANMFARHSGSGPGERESNYGYGVWLGKSAEGYAPYFQGCDPGVSFISELEPRTETTIVLASNSGDDVWGIAQRLSNELRG